MDTLVSHGLHSTLLVPIYRKPTHLDQYLYWHSHHSLFAKYCVLTSLHIEPKLSAPVHGYYKKKRNTKRALLGCKYPIWALNRLLINNTHKYSTTQAHNTNNYHINKKTTINIPMVVPYTKGLSEMFKNIYGETGVQVFFK